jgi:spore germination protein KA
MLRVGRRTSTAVFVCYLGTLANVRTVDLIKKRIEKIDIDGVLDTNYITEQIKDNKFSLFKTSGTTERPDVVAARLLEGRIAIVVDGTPMVATVPYLFSENFQSDEDYYQNFLLSSAERLLRYFCFALSISIPAVFIALSTLHRQLLPTTFAISVMQLRGGVPFTPLGECLIMILVFEILKEAGIRMSQNLGHALSIVGGLVVGQAAVEARIISSPILITVALSGIAGLMLPRLKTAVFYLRILFVLLSAFLGLYGYIMGAIFLGIYILSVYSYAIDYTVSLKKASFQSLKDTLIRASWKNMNKRPLFNRNTIRKRRNK